MRDDLAKELEQIGLSENEAKVYLAGLELGPSTAQMIAAKATVSRPTTYIMIESLIKRGLMSSFQKGKKSLFSCFDPNGLRTFFKSEEEELSRKKEGLEHIIPALLNITTLAAPPKVSLFEGGQGISQIQQIMLDEAKVSGQIDNIAAVDVAREQRKEIDLNPLWQDLLKNRIKIRTIYTSDQEVRYPGQEEYWLTKRIDKSKFPFSGEISIFGNKIAALSLKGKNFGIVIESQEIAQTLRVLFELAWSSK